MNGTFPPKALIRFLEACKATTGPDSYDLFACSLPKSVQQRVVPQDASCEDLDVNESLPFLDSFVQASLQNGAAPYLSEQDRCKTSL